MKLSNLFKREDNHMEKKIISGYPLIINYLGIFAILVGIINMIPLVLIAFRTSEIANAHLFLIPGIASMLIGFIIVLLFKGREKGKLERHQDAILVVSIWIMAILISSIPFLLTGNYTFTQSVFEATSGYSTTGLTVTDVESAPDSLLLFRSLLQFFGGIGLVLVLTSAVSDKFGMRLYSAEGHSDKLMPNLIRSARMILSIYIGYIIIGSIFYIIFGMEPFDAINHSISAVATGGFSTKALSIGHYNSLAIEITTIVLMILGGTNFFVHLMLLRGKLKNVIAHVEIKLLGIMILITLPLFTINLLSVYNGDLGQSLRVGIFQFFSAVTGTGYQTVDTFVGPNVPVLFFFGLIIFMVLGAGMGSTAGGMKQYRVALAFKSLYWNMKEQLSHKKTTRTHFINKIGTRTIVEKEDIIQNHSFIMIYMIVLLIGTIIYTGYGHSLSLSLFEFSSALGTVGLSVGLTSISTPPLLLWTSIFGMFLGRLEFYVIFIAITKVTMDIKRGKQPFKRAEA
ncbi:MAG: TrkH family potassium uptake protein [Acholeplasmataceae bacterium]|nr:TrkH family potassium uptake protein [Acholeplasmataceae bacterium]